MNTKLTLSLDATVIEKAKKYAKSNNKSLSHIIEVYLKKIIKEETNSTDLTPIVKSIKGTFSPTGNFDYKDELKKKLFNKYIWSNENSI